MNDKIDSTTLKALKNTPKLPQRQDSLVEQLHDLFLFATKLGMYDAADWIVNGSKLSPNTPIEGLEGTTMGKFYSWFEDETLEEAIKNHAIGFKSIQDAIDESNASDSKPSKFKVIDWQGKVVFEGITKPID